MKRAEVCIFLWLFALMLKVKAYSYKKLKKAW